MSCAFRRTIGHLMASITRSSGLVVIRVPRLCWYAVGLIASYGAAVPGLALTLDAIAEQSQLGQAFRIVVPVVLQPGEELSGECLNVIPSHIAVSDDVPEILWARIALERAANSARLVVTNGRAVNDPAMRITLEVGCDRAIRREYMILFDPPLRDAAMVDATGTVVASPDTASVSAPSSEAAPLAAAAATPALLPAPMIALDASPAEQARPAIDKGAALPVIPRRRPGSTADQPRLAVSRTVHGTGASERGSGENFAAMSKSAQMAAVEEQEVVLRKRVAELTVLVERMQQERIVQLSAEVERLQLEVRTAEAARRAAEDAARMSPWGAIAHWDGENWPGVVAVLAIFVLLAGGILAWRRRSVPSRIIPGEPPLMANSQSGLVETYLDEGPIAGPTMVPHSVTVQSPNSYAGRLDIKPPETNEHEDAFDNDVAPAQGQPAEKLRG